MKAHDVLANITKDDDTTAASIIYSFEKPHYPHSRVFFSPKNVDGIYTVSSPESTMAHDDWKHEIYAYTENVPIYVSAVPKQGITVEKILWKMQLELRRIAEAYPLGSVRKFGNISPSYQDAGLLSIPTMKYILEFKRAAEDYTSDVTLSYGAGWEFDGLRTTGGTEGIWLLTDGGNTTQTVTQYPGYFTLAITAPFVADSYSISGDPVTTDTNLDLSSTIYTTLRFRYRTYASTKAKVILGYSTYDSAETPVQNVADGDAVLVMAETASTTWSIVTYSIPTGKIVDHVIVYACDGAGYVQVDWMEIYKDDFVFPNAVDIRPDPTSRNINLGVPSGMVLGGQNLGADPEMLEIDCDLDMQTSSTAGVDGCWLRVGDTDRDEVFRDIIHNQSIAGAWQWLVYGNKSMRVIINGAPTRWKNGTLTLRLEEYSDSNMANGTYKERFNL